ncbi:MAG TPA: forespore capture DNA-binding protein RefZ [Bacilli bacterium]|nr:forespore capture DNA-binding protein RefZ [Bacilli bacterium]
MTDAQDCTRIKMIDAAIKLFNAQGYSGTSVRDICHEANVNPALISYYFGSKKGLLESLLVQFFEEYLHILEETLAEQGEHCARQLLLTCLKRALIYQQENHHLSRFVHREITIDTMLVRELMSTYLMKEKHIFYHVLKRGMDQHEFKKQPIDFIIIQLRGMLTMPFLHPQYIREVHHLVSHEQYFINHYLQYLTQWVDSYLCIRTKVKVPTFVRATTV